MRQLDLVGKTFGKLYVVAKLECRDNRTYFECKCDCGNIRVVRGVSLTGKEVSCCGCSNGDARRQIKYLNRTLYEVWKGMKARCRDSKHASFKNYGGKGVVVCKEWEESFIPFYEWSVANGYKKGLQIDKDLKGNGLLYSPESCCFITAKENSRMAKRIKMDMNKALVVRQSNEKVATLAIRYNVSKSTIWRIKSNNVWM